MVSLHTLWPIAEDTFRVLMANLLLRPRHPLATEEECRRPMLGDRWVPSPDFESTHGVDVAAPPEGVWRWVAQLLRNGRTYGWPKLERPAIRSGRMVLADLPAPCVGERAGGVFVLVAVDPGTELVWCSRGAVGVLGVRLDRITFDYQVLPNAGGSRVIGRHRCVSHDATVPLRVHAFQVVDFILPGQQLANVKKLAESPQSGNGVAAPPQGHSG